jgi:hypothetical protein
MYVCVCVCVCVYVCIVLFMSLVTHKTTLKIVDNNCMTTYGFLYQSIDLDESYLLIYGFT